MDVNKKNRKKRKKVCGVRCVHFCLITILIGFSRFFESECNEHNFPKPQQVHEVERNRREHAQKLVKQADAAPLRVVQIGHGKRVPQRNEWYNTEHKEENHETPSVVDVVRALLHFELKQKPADVYESCRRFAS